MKDSYTIESLPGNSIEILPGNPIKAPQEDHKNTSGSGSSDGIESAVNKMNTVSSNHTLNTETKYDKILEKHGKNV